MTISIILLFLSSIASAVIVSPPNGTYGVASSVVELVDTSRQDPYGSGHSKRHLMLSTFYPVGLLKDCNAYTSPYMPPLTAAAHNAAFGLPNSTFESFELSLCAPNKPLSRSSHNSFPVVLFSPGLGNSRLLYNTIAQSLSSQGFVVITVDHPYDASIVEYPDGSFVEAANITTDDQIAEDVSVRQADVSFIIDQLHKRSTKQQFFNFVDSKYVDHVLISGHSLGGATAAAAMLNDCRLAAGVNLDGTLFGPVLEHGLTCPFAVFSHEGKNVTTDPSWVKVWPKLSSTRLSLSITGSEHGTFTDMPLLARTLGLTEHMTDEIASLLGTIDSAQFSAILNTYMGAFFRFAVGNTRSPLVAGSMADFPELQILEKDVRGRCIRA